MTDNEKKYRLLFAELLRFRALNPDVPVESEVELIENLDRAARRVTAEEYARVDADVRNMADYELAPMDEYRYMEATVPMGHIEVTRTTRSRVGDSMSVTAQVTGVRGIAWTPSRRMGA